MRRLKERLTFANVTASLALFIALGGTSYAAIALPRNSVGANQLRTGSVRSSEVKDRSLNARDLSIAARRFLKGQRGEQGERGPAGPTGPTGPSGGGGTSVVITQETTTGTVALGEIAGATATCGPNRRATGGGVRIDSAGDTAARESYPSGNGTSWTARVENNNEGPDGSPPDSFTGPFTFTVFVICAG